MKKITLVHNEQNTYGNTLVLPLLSKIFPVCLVWINKNYLRMYWNISSIRHIFIETHKQYLKYVHKWELNNLKYKNELPTSWNKCFNTIIGQPASESFYFIAPIVIVNRKLYFYKGVKNNLKKVTLQTWKTNSFFMFDINRLLCWLDGFLDAL